jgi:hypothetical protein
MHASMWTAGVFWSFGCDHETMHWLQDDSYVVGHSPRTTVNQGDGVVVCEGGALVWRGACVLPPRNAVHLVWTSQGHVCVVLCCMLYSAKCLDCCSSSC